MAESLEDDIKTLQEIFSKESGSLRIFSQSSREFICRLTLDDGSKIELQANATDEYPRLPPVWFSYPTNTDVNAALDKLSVTTGQDNLILPQIRILLESLRGGSSLSNLDHYLETVNKKIKEQSEGPGVAETEDKGKADDDNYSAVMKILKKDLKKEGSPIKEVPKNILTRLENLKLGSRPTSNRIMKELKHINNSRSYKNGDFDIELDLENIYVWNIKLRKLSMGSKIHEDLKLLSEKSGIDHVLFEARFSPEFPFEPPVLYVLYPKLTGENIKDGAVLLYMLTREGWSSVYTMETVVMQISAMLAKSGARIDFSDSSFRTTNRSRRMSKSIFSQVASSSSSSSSFTTGVPFFSKKIDTESKTKMSAEL